MREGEKGWILLGKTVVLGVGNYLLRDEGVGVHAVRALAGRPLPPGVELVDGGTAGFDLLPLLLGAERVIVIDAVRAGGVPGAVYRLPLAECELRPREPGLSLHDAGLAEVFHALKLLTPEPPEVVLIGVEPASLELGTELSPAVSAKLPLILDLVEEELRRTCPGTSGSL